MLFRNLLLALALVLTAAFSPNEELTTPDGTQYTLNKKLGGGSFGEVWQATQKGTQIQVAMKFFVASPIGTQNIQRLVQLTPLLNSKPQNNVLKVYGMQKVSSTEQKRDFSTLITELGNTSAESLVPTDFQITSNLDKAEKIRRLKNLIQLKNNLITGATELNELDLVHHDINPRNVISVNGSYKISDFDGVTRVGAPPPPGSFEATFAAMEYSGNQLREYGPLADLNTIANTLFYAMNKITPLELFAESYYENELKQHGYQMIWALREKLLQDTEFQKRYEEMLKTVFKGMFESGLVPSESLKEFGELTKFMSAALTIPPENRRESLRKILPNLPQLKPVNLSKKPTGSQPHFTFSICMDPLGKLSLEQ